MDIDTSRTKPTERERDEFVAWLTAHVDDDIQQIEITARSIFIRAGVGVRGVRHGDELTLDLDETLDAMRLPRDLR